MRVVAKIVRVLYRMVLCILALAVGIPLVIIIMVKNLLQKKKAYMFAFVNFLVIPAVLSCMMKYFGMTLARDYVAFASYALLFNAFFCVYDMTRVLKMHAYVVAFNVLMWLCTLSINYFLAIDGWKFLLSTVHGVSYLALLNIAAAVVLFFAHLIKHGSETLRKCGMRMSDDMTATLPHRSAIVQTTFVCNLLIWIVDIAVLGLIYYLISI